MAGLREFSARVSRIAAALPQGANAVKRKTASAILQSVVVGTPVGNTTLWSEQARRMARPGYVGGRARGNWFVSIGAPVATVTDATDAAGRATLARGEAVINEAPPLQAIHIVNNLPYIVPLNQGHSKQAPAGFVEMAVMKGIQHLQALRILDEVPK
jgi:hypothetical protein